MKSRDIDATGFGSSNAYSIAWRGPLEPPAVSDPAESTRDRTESDDEHTPRRLTPAGPTAPGRRRGSLVVFGIALVLYGAALAVGGAQLVWLGGSWYYLLAGPVFATAGVQYMQQRASALVWLGAVFMATLAWAYAEVGLDYWQWVPRAFVPTLLAMVGLLLAPRLGTWPAKPVYALAAALCAALIGALGESFVPHGVIGAQRIASAAAPLTPPAAMSADWRHYGRTASGTRFAPFDQINKDNVGQLEVAWMFRTGRDTAGATDEDQNTPIQVGNTVYACTPHNVVFALNADTGEERWRFDPQASSPVWQRCRGLGYFERTATAEAGTGQCAQRIVLTTIDARLIELDRRTGKPCKEFGNGGTVDLKAGMGQVNPGFYFPTSAPTVARGLIIIGGWVWDDVSIDEPSGVVRAFDANTGALVWAWDLGNPARAGLPPRGETYTRGTPNVWSTPAFDDRLGLIYVPTGNETPDFWGGKRKQASEVYSSSVVALDVETGRERWKFQTVRHDVWDYDVPSQPVLYDVPDDRGGLLRALVLLTKRGQIFLLDRRDGKPIAEVQERRVPQTPVAEGDWLAPTQPYSVAMPALGAEPLRESDMWGITPLDHLWCRIEFRSLRYDGEFTPPGLTKSLQYPGFYGGMNWGSASIDETAGLLIVNDIRRPHVVQLIPRYETERRLAANKPTTDSLTGLSAQAGTPFGAEKYLFRSPLGVPCIKPPYGTLSAIHLKTRQLVWQVPMGTVQDAGPRGVKLHMPMPVGLPTFGGPMTTAAGLVFYAGTKDYYLRALDVANGAQLWKGRLPVGAQATPMTYVSPDTGRQYVLISAGGARGSADRGDYIIAYALPKKKLRSTPKPQP